MASNASSKAFASLGSISNLSIGDFLLEASIGILDSPRTTVPSFNVAFNFILSKVTGITFPVTAKTSLIFFTASSKLVDIPSIAAKKRFPKLWFFNLPSGNLYCNNSSIRGSVSESANIQFRISPGGSIPKSSLKSPEPPPSSATVTIAVILLVYCLRPLSIVESPVPPPITTILGPFTNNLFSYIRFPNLREFIWTLRYPLLISTIIDFINLVAAIYIINAPVAIINK